MVSTRNMWLLPGTTVACCLLSLKTSANIRIVFNEHPMYALAPVMAAFPSTQSIKMSVLTLVLIIIYTYFLLVFMFSVLFFDFWPYVHYVVYISANRQMMINERFLHHTPFSILIQQYRFIFVMCPCC